MFYEEKDALAFNYLYPFESLIPCDFGRFWRWHSQMFDMKGSILVEPLRQNKTIFREYTSMINLRQPLLKIFMQRRSAGPTYCFFQGYGY